MESENQLQESGNQLQESGNQLSGIRESVAGIRNQLQESAEFRWNPGISCRNPRIRCWNPSIRSKNACFKTFEGIRVSAEKLLLKEFGIRQFLLESVENPFLKFGVRNPLKIAGISCCGQNRELRRWMIQLIFGTVHQVSSANSPSPRIGNHLASPLPYRSTNFRSEFLQLFDRFF